MVLLLALLTRIGKLVHEFKIVKIIIKGTFITLLITCLITNQSISMVFSEIFNNKLSSKAYKVQLIKEFIDKEEPKNRNFNFLAPENNYIHWKLDESRHGFPQKAVFRNISKGKMDKLIYENRSLDFKFILPTKNQLCETLNNNAPPYIITKKNDYSFNCLKQKNSKYELLVSTSKLNKNNIFIFKRIYK